MKMSCKQMEEIDFLSTHIGNFIPSEEEKIGFINLTAKGIGKKNDIRYEENRLIIAKRKLDITVKMWREDMRDGLLYYKELEEDFNSHPYLIKILNTIREQLIPKISYDGVLGIACIGYLNSKFNTNHNIYE